MPIISRILIFNFLLLQFSLEKSIAQKIENVSGLYLQSPYETKEIKKKKKVRLLIQQRLNDSTFNLIEKEGKIISFKESKIVFSNERQFERLVVNNVRKQTTITFFWKEWKNETLDLGEVVAFVFYPRGAGFIGYYYSINKEVVHNSNCTCTRDVLQKYLKPNFKLVKLE